MKSLQEKTGVSRSVGVAARRVARVNLTTVCCVRTETALSMPLRPRVVCYARARLTVTVGDSGACS